MKYNINLKNVKIEGVASIESLDVAVEYSVGEIPEILGHVLPFIERLTGEVLPTLADKFVETRQRVQEIDDVADERRTAQRMAERMVEESSSRNLPKTWTEMFSQELEAAAAAEQRQRQRQPESFEDMLKRRLDNTADDKQKTEQFLDCLDRALEDVIRSHENGRM